MPTPMEIKRATNKTQMITKAKNGIVASRDDWDSAPVGAPVGEIVDAACAEMRAIEGDEVGTLDGNDVGLDDGASVGNWVVAAVGAVVGVLVGENVGYKVGEYVGARVGRSAQIVFDIVSELQQVPFVFFQKSLQLVISMGQSVSMLIHYHTRHKQSKRH